MTAAHEPSCQHHSRTTLQAKRLGILVSLLSLLLLSLVFARVSRTQPASTPQTTSRSAVAADKFNLPTKTTIPTSPWITQKRTTNKHVSVCQSHIDIGVEGEFICGGGQALGVYGQTEQDISNEDGLLVILYDETEEPIPLGSEIGTVTNLRWLAYVNTGTGTIPTQVGLLSHLQLFYLRSCHFEGTLPSEVGMLRAVKEFRVTNNLLQGTLPSELGGLTKLSVLALPNNLFFGTVPSEIGQLTKLTKLKLHISKLGGFVPSQLGRLTQLTDLGLHQSLFTRIPTELALLTALEYLDLTDNPLEGTIPTQLFAIETLREVSIQTTGVVTIPETAPMWTSSNLNTLSIRNALRAIPTTIGHATNMVVIRWHATTPTTVPSQLGLLTNLETIELTASFVGTLPSQIGNLNKISLFVLSGTGVGGTIPTQLGLLTQLAELDLTNTNFVGQYPDQLNSFTFVSCENSGLTNPQCNPDVLDYLSEDTVFIPVVTIGAVVVVLLVLVTALVVLHRFAHVFSEDGVWLTLVTLAGLLLVCTSLPLTGVTMIDTDKSTRTMACKWLSQVSPLGAVMVVSAVSARNYPLLQAHAKHKHPISPIRIVVGMCVVTVLFGVPLSIQLEASTKEPGCTFRRAGDVLFCAMLNLAAHFSFSCWLARVIAKEEAARRKPLPRASVAGRENQNNQDNDKDQEEGKRLMRACFNFSTFAVATGVVAFGCPTTLSRFVATGACMLLSVLMFLFIAIVPKILIARKEMRDPVTINPNPRPTVPEPMVQWVESDVFSTCDEAS